MEKERLGKFNYEKDITNSGDILGARNKVQEYAHLLGFQKPEVTVLTTAASEVYRLFLDTTEEVSTKIYSIEDIDSTGISLQVSGTINNNSPPKELHDPSEIKHELAQKLEKIKDFFCEFEFTFQGADIIILTLKKRIRPSREQKYLKNN